jgi:hypothetical protein
LQCWRAWAIPGALVAAWYLVLLLHFHTIVPHGALAKKLIYYEFIFGESILLTVLNVFSYNTFGSKLVYPWFTYAFMLLFMFRIMCASDKSLFYYAIGAGLLALFLLVTNPPAIFSWYFAPFALFPCLAIPVACIWLWRQMNEEHRLPFAVGMTGLVAYFAFAPIGNGVPKIGIFGTNVPCPFFYWDGPAQRLLLYRRAAEYLAMHPVSEAASVAVPEPGMFGYAYRGNVLDLGGLVSDEVLPYYPVPLEQRSRDFNFSISPLAVRETKPEVVLTYDFFAKSSILRDDFFLASYQLEKSWPLELWGGRGLYLYRLKKVNQ